MSAAYILIPPSLSRGKIASTSAIFVWPQQAESNFHEAKTSPVHENLRTLFQRQRLPGRRQRGGRGPTGENKKIAVSHQACPRLFFGCRPWNSGATSDKVSEPTTSQSWCWLCATENSLYLFNSSS